MAGFTVKLRLREIDPFENFMFTASLSSLESASEKLAQQAVVRGVVDIHSFDH